MLTLAADTSTSINSVALCDGERLLCESTADAGRRHAERLLSTVDWVLGESGATLDDVKLLAVSVGPGSFTGLRIGVSTLKGLALSKRLPLIGVPTLDAMTHLAPGMDGTVCVLLDARMHEVYAAVYEIRDGSRERRTPDMVARVETVLDRCPANTLFIGDGAEAYRDRIQEKIPTARFLPSASNVPRASAVALEAYRLDQDGAAGNAGDVNPVYLRQSQAEAARGEKALS